MEKTQAPTLEQLLELAKNSQYVMVNFNTLKASVDEHGNDAQKKKVNENRQTLIDILGENLMRMTPVNPDLIEELIKLN